MVWFKIDSTIVGGGIGLLSDALKQLEMLKVTLEADDLDSLIGIKFKTNRREHIIMLMDAFCNPIPVVKPVKVEEK